MGIIKFEKNLNLHISHHNRHQIHHNVVWLAPSKVTTAKKSLKKMMEEQDLDPDGSLDQDTKIMDDPKADDLKVDDHHTITAITAITATTNQTIQNQFIRNPINQVKNQFTKNLHKNPRKNQHRSQQPTNHTNLQ